MTRGTIQSVKNKRQNSKAKDGGRGICHVTYNGLSIRLADFSTGSMEDWGEGYNTFRGLKEIDLLFKNNIPSQSLSVIHTFSLK